MTFAEAHARAAPFTIVTRERCELLWNEAGRAPAGDFAEVGVYRGGSAMLLRLAAPERRLHLFDTFVGHPDIVSPHDSIAHPAGRYADTVVADVIERVGSGKLTVWAGPFGDPALAAWRWTRLLALVHIDVDLYESTRAVCALLLPALVPGGVAICDDYSDDDCPGAKRAIDEYAAAYLATLTLTIAETGQAVLR